MVKRPLPRRRRRNRRNNGVSWIVCTAIIKEMVAMAEERITEVETPSGNTHTTVVTDAPRTGGGATWLILLLLLVVVAVAAVYLSGMSGAEVAKDNAVADAAEDVGTAAGQVGDAAQDAADAVTN
jgi:uncharacterized protein HemX